MKRALLLNADWQAMNFISDIDAFILLFKKRAEIVQLTDKPSVWDECFASPGPPGGSLRQHPIPATVRLLTKCNKRRASMRFKKRILFNRDGWKCQYCGVELSYNTITVDHVMPSSRGGATSWLNCVASCKPCNRFKADMTPDEAEMRLLKKPAVPSGLHFWDTHRSASWHDDWHALLPNNF